MSATAFLSDSQLAQIAPSVFAPQQHASRSGRYNFIPTAEIVGAMRKEGLAPVKVQVQRVRDDSRRGFEKHMIRFRRLDTLARSVGDVFPEVVLINSHDGSTSYQLMAGLFRLVCSNGLVVADGQTDGVRIKHFGRNALEDVIDASFTVLRQSEIGAATASRWAQIQLVPQEQTALAIGAHHARFADADGNINTPIRPEALLTPRRSDDRKNDLWTTFNRVQENVIRGGLRGIGRDDHGRPRRVRTRTVNGIDGDVTLNRSLWRMAEYLERMKTSAN